MKLKIALISLVTALCFVTLANAQEEKKNSRYEKIAKDRVEAMSRRVEMDKPTRLKVTDLMYDYVAGREEAKKKKDSMTDDEYTNEVRRLTRVWVDGTRKTLPKDQVEAFNEWNALPLEERFKK